MFAATKASVAAIERSGEPEMDSALSRRSSACHSVDCPQAMFNNPRLCDALVRILPEDNLQVRAVCESPQRDKPGVNQVEVEKGE